MTFCEILRSLAEDKNITQKQLAIDLHIPVSTVGGYFQGISEPDFDTLKMFASYFGVSTDYLLDFRNAETENHDEDELIYIFRKMHNTQQKIFIEQGKAILKVNRQTEAK